jgi:hypothetical protein
VTADPRRLPPGNRRAAERLLRGVPADPARRRPADGAEAELARVLAAAAAPGRIDPEREEAAVASFRAAASERPRSRWSRRTARAGMGAAVAAVVLAGAAVAAGTGVVPDPFHPGHGTHSASPRPSAPGHGAAKGPGPSDRPSGPPGSAATGDAAGSGGGTGSSGHTRGPGGHGSAQDGARAASGQVTQLCQDYEDARNGLRAPLAVPDANLLAEVAGGSSNVPGYCVRHLGTGTGEDQDHTPSEHPHPTPTPKPPHTPGGGSAHHDINVSVPTMPTTAPHPCATLPALGAVTGGATCLP